VIEIEIIKKEPDSPDARLLMDQLSEALEKITGNNGRHSFETNDVRQPRGLFAIAYINEDAVGCAAMRPIDKDTAEVKRMFAKVSGKGIGSELLSYLEDQARKIGYNKIILETRLINQKAVLFYKSKAYKRIQNYGKYAGHSESVCFEKWLS
jgi:GNAT superfamily N-acetyltransferase